MKKRFTEEQIIGVLKEAEAGMKVAEVCRKHGISDATYYNWKSKFGGMTVTFANFIDDALHLSFNVPRCTIDRSNQKPLFATNRIDSNRFTVDNLQLRRHHSQ